jgi:hypothetical protein
VLCVLMCHVLLYKKQQQQPLFCGMFLGGTIALAGVTVLFLGQPTEEMCLARPWFQHVALTFTLSCLLVKVCTATTTLNYLAIPLRVFTSFACAHYYSSAANTVYCCNTRKCYEVMTDSCTIAPALQLTRCTQHILLLLMLLYIGAPCMEAILK